MSIFLDKLVIINRQAQEGGLSNVAKDLVGEECTSDEVWSVVKFMYSMKCHGPDGIQLAYFRKNWSIMGKSVTHLV